MTFLFFLLILFTFSSCSDDDLTGGSQQYDDGQTNVTLNITAQAPGNPLGGTRAPVLENGNEDEMMKSWFVLIVHNDSIKRIVTSKDSSSYKQEDSNTTRLQNGEYTFYSFANIPIDSLGLTTASVDTELPQDFDSRALTVKGNCQSIAGFPDGIPMSNKETFTVGPTTNQINLLVIRMVVKVRLQLTNTTNEDMRVTRFSINDITKNAKDNLKLFPGAISDESTGKRQVNLNNISKDDSTKKETFVYNVVPADSQLLTPNQSRTYEFYVNESEARSNINHFVIGITTTHETRDLSTGSNTTVTRNRYAFINWNNIARNEIYILPIGLERYHIEFYVRAFTAIGVLPMVNNETDIATIDFGLYGHYDIIPRIRDMVTGRYYHIQNNTYQQNITVFDSTYVDRTTNQQNSTTKQTNDITIDSLKLYSVNDIAIPWDQGGWGSNPDGTLKSGESPHYPTVGWNETAMTPRIECITGNYTGWAIYTVNASFTAGGEHHFITRQFRINNTYVDLSQLAKRHRW